MTAWFQLAKMVLLAALVGLVAAWWLSPLAAAIIATLALYLLLVRVG